jgi:hypothetical protein
LFIAVQHPRNWIFSNINVPFQILTHTPEAQRTKTQPLPQFRILGPFASRSFSSALPAYYDSPHPDRQPFFQGVA